jgi:uncharacterized protein
MALSGVSVSLPAVIEQKRPAIEALCLQYGVDRLFLFGSAATGRFDAARSDLDFIVEFNDRASKGFANPYFRLLEAFEVLFQRKVDLITEQSLENPYRRRRIEAEKIPLYPVVR